MKLPKTPKPKFFLTEGYTEKTLIRFAKQSAYKALQENSVGWEKLTEDEILKLIPEGEKEINKFIYFAKQIDKKLMEINTWHL